MEIQKLTAVSLGKKIKEKEISVREALDAVFAQIDQTEDRYHAYVTLDKEGAYKQADAVQEKIDKGELTGALAGVPVAIKDNMCTKGLLTTCSSKNFENYITYTASAVQNLTDAGCVIIERQTWMSLRWEVQQRLHTMVLQEILIIQTMFQAVLQEEVQQQLP